MTNFTEVVEAYYKRQKPSSKRKSIHDAGSGTDPPSISLPRRFANDIDMNKEAERPTKRARISPPPTLLDISFSELIPFVSNFSV